MSKVSNLEHDLSLCGSYLTEERKINKELIEILIKCRKEFSKQGVIHNNKIISKIDNILTKTKNK